MLNGTITQTDHLKLPGILPCPRHYGVCVVQDNRNISHILAYDENSEELTPTIPSKQSHCMTLLVLYSIVFFFPPRVISGITETPISTIAAKHYCFVKSVAQCARMVYIHELPALSGAPTYKHS